jgi:hypothetical protein
MMDAPQSPSSSADDLEFSFLGSGGADSSDEDFSDASDDLGPVPKMPRLGSYSHT